MLIIWLKTLRWQMCVLALFLAYTSFAIANVAYSWNLVLYLFATWLVTDVTMRQNDWRDRYHDIKKGREYVLEYEPSFLRILRFEWSALLLLNLFSTMGNFSVGLVIVGMTAVAGIYSEIRKIPFVPIALVSITAASPILLASAFEGWKYQHSLLFFAVVSIIFSREIMNDLFDLKADRGYKWTIPQQFPPLVSNCLVLLGYLLSLGLLLYGFGTMILFGGLLSLVGVCLILATQREYPGYHLLDGGMLLVLLSVNVTS
jgi:hypothetical protein